MTSLGAIQEILGRLHITAEPAAFAAGYTLTVARTLATIAFIPFLGGQAVPGNIRVGLAMVIGAILYPSLAGSSESAPAFLSWLYFAMLLKELLIGTVIGLLCQLVFAAAEAAGALIEFCTGLQARQVSDPQTPTATSATGVLLGHSAIVIYLSTGLHRIFLRALIESYTQVPLFGWPQFRPSVLGMADAVGSLASSFIVTAFQLSAPFILVLLLLHIGSGFILRMSFSRMASNPVQPLSTIAVFGLLLVSAGLTSDQIAIAGRRDLQQVSRLIEAFR